MADDFGKISGGWYFTWYLGDMADIFHWIFSWLELSWTQTGAIVNSEKPLGYLFIDK